MQNKITLIKGYALLILLLAVYIGYGIFTYKDFGITADEYSSYISGDIWYHHYINEKSPNDFMVRYNPIISEHNRIYPALLFSIIKVLDYDSFHLLNILFSAPIFITAYLFVWKYYKKYWAGVLVVLFLFLTPRFMGDIPANPKDIPFAVAYFISTVLIFLSNTQFFKKYPYLKILLIGGLLGYTQSIRAVGFTLYPVLFVWTLINTPEKKKNLITVFLETLSTFVVSLFVMCVIWPAIGFNFFANFKKYLFLSSGYDLWDGNTLFNGNRITGQQIPFYYLPVWLGISTPLIFLLLTGAGFYFLFKKSSSTLLKFSAGLLIYNFIIYFIVRPVSYNGVRHFLYLVVWISFFSGLVFYELSGFLSKKKYLLLSSVAFLYLLFTAYKMYLLYPYYYSYFNEALGSYSKASSKFDSDYWGSSYKEASKYIVTLSKDYTEKKLKYLPCKMGFAMNYYLEGYAEQVEQPKNADYFICDDSKYRELKLDGTKVMDIVRQGHVYESIYIRNKRIPQNVYKDPI